jgi:predicted thioesterase
MSTLNRGHRVTEATAALVALGEMTSMELAEYLDIDRYDARAVLCRMAKRTKAGVKRVHISRYVHDFEGARKYPRPVYALGDQEDVKKPKANQLAVKRKYYARQKNKVLMNSVFNMGLKWRAA